VRDKKPRGHFPQVGIGHMNRSLIEFLRKKSVTTPSIRLHNNVRRGKIREFR